ncbi:hypothetical protein P2318_23350 [Myxococcaceae bacterium GXIMD 01537]
MNDTLDRWIQRATLAAVLAVALTLLTVGVSLYASNSEARGPVDNVSAVP